MDKGNPPRVIMSFDFGLKHIGLAIGQEVTRTAHTFYSIKAVDGMPKWQELDPIVHEWRPALFVVGDPLNMDGTISKIKERNLNNYYQNQYHSISHELIAALSLEKPQSD